MTRCVAPGCVAIATELHHCVYQQHCRQHGGDTGDPRNMIPCCARHHSSHHARYQVLPLWVLPDSVFDFARELMGEAPAFVWLSRYYIGSDPRLDALVAQEAA